MPGLMMVRLPRPRLSGSFTVSLSANVGTKRGKGRGSFVASVLDSVETFYAEVVQHIKPWTPPPVKIRDDEPSITDTEHTPEMAATPGGG
jgi:hypothetical protein